ncbi:MAG TPA: hypothetical protein VFS87_10705 [Qipengyuania sp.]|nr:hypothetical protein [Qipengyuania sp.]
MPKRLAHKYRRRPPFFRPVPLRGRVDGWSEARQCGFLAQLYVTGSVAAAARAVGMSRRGAFRLRERSGAESFAHAWDHVLTPPGSGRQAAYRPDYRKVTVATLSEWLETGYLQPVIYRGRMCGIRRKPDDSALFRLLRRTGRFDDPYWSGAGE